MSALLTRTSPAVDTSAFEAITAGLVPHSFAGLDDVRSVGAQLRASIGMHVGPFTDGAHLARLAISPGTVAIRLQHVGLLDVADDLDADPLSRLPGSVGDDIDRRVQGALFDVDPRAGLRGVVSEWSRGSRRRMVRTIAELDLSTWHEDGGQLCLLTLTLPDWWELLAPTGARFKRLVDVLRKRWLREVGTPWRGLWKLEFQERGAPHMHMLMRVPAMAGSQTFERWLARAWADVCRDSLSGLERAHYDLLGEYDRHLRRGTDISWSGVQFSDPRRTSIYFLKHASKSSGSKEYQHRVPALWQAEGAGPGRFWGVWGLDRAVDEILLDRPVMHRLRRILRGVARGRTAATTISRLRAGGDPAGIWSMPRQKQRSLTTAGGWVLVNDGLALALALRRAL